MGVLNNKETIYVGSIEPAGWVQNEHATNAVKIEESLFIS